MPMAECQIRKGVFMTPKIEKLKEEKQKNIEKIKGWQKKIANAEERNQVIDRKIIECENTEIIGMIRTSDFTVEEIVELLSSAKATKGGN